MPTVRGPVAAAELGRTLPHEHVLILQPEALQNYGHVWGESYWDEDARVRDAIEKLRAVRDAGYRTLVDPTAPGLGRYIPRIQRINAEVDLNIVVATGVYAFVELPELPPLPQRRGDRGALRPRAPRGHRRHRRQGGVHQVRGRGARARRRHPADSRRGGDRCDRDRRAGDGAHERVERRPGRWRSTTLTRRGVEPSRIVVAHAGDSNDLDYLRAIADTGATLGFDRFNIEHFNPDDDRIRTLLALLEEGYGDRIHLSHDAACFMDFMVGDPNFANERPDYLHLSTTILPALRERGVTEAQIDEMTIDNPRRFLAPS